MTIASNLEEIRAEISSVAQACGRHPEDIKLVAVSKRFPASAIAEAMAEGQQLFGENYIQEAQTKLAEVPAGASFHFIGHLQRNKAKIAASLFDVVETIDSYRLAAALDRHLEELGRSMRVLVQVNIGEDPGKAGVHPDDTRELIEDLNKLSHLQVSGLMTMPPIGEEPEEARLHFRHLRQLAETLTDQGLLGRHGRVELSMGMSGDYQVAIEEGATIVRIGTAIFGHR